LDLCRPELGCDPRVGNRSEHELDRLCGRERLRVDEDQLLLDPDREQVALRVSTFVRRCQTPCSPKLDRPSHPGSMLPDPKIAVWKVCDEKVKKAPLPP